MERTIEVIISELNLLEKMRDQENIRHGEIIQWIIEQMESRIEEKEDLESFLKI
jgi:hypothetical protein